ncbi:putative phenylalanine ammonia-lyase [Camillea tinctor]|nr:putative phenylalanine ammonia-lyase [Camillea tinctor]
MQLHIDITYEHWSALKRIVSSGRPVAVDGQNLSLADVIAVSNHNLPVIFTEDNSVSEAIDESISFLDRQISAGRIIYGVNTGFGGSADVRTQDTTTLQASMVQHVNVGILLPSDKGIHHQSEGKTSIKALKSHALPQSAVRGMLLIRGNSLARGHSGVRVQIIEQIFALLRKRATPVVPLRGSISASGDLAPLSYLAGTLEGNPDIYVNIDSDNPVVMSANDALKALEIQPTQLQAKEALGITNGTATSTSLASLVLFEANQLAVLSQMLTAMATEALLGTLSNYHPFISDCRPHRGQREAAANILQFLTNSKLTDSREPGSTGLAQDRYALRTAAQWIGPLLENLDLSTKQVEAELNSTTDNPLIDTSGSTIHHGGNFQAASITSAMEKITSSMQLLGKLIFAQSSELLNNKLNNNLPPNLAADDPSMSFTMKGFDTNMAAYMSELAYLAHPVSAHVQSAEMHNQSVNSLALISARVALEAVEVLSLMFATYLYTLCQALDLRVLEIEFERRAKFVHDKIFQDSLSVLPVESIGLLRERAWRTFISHWSEHSHLDLPDRGRQATEDSASKLLISIASNVGEEPAQTIKDQMVATRIYCTNFGKAVIDLYDTTRCQFFECQTTRDYIGFASGVLYDFVRTELDIPMHRGLVDHPSLEGLGTGKQSMQTLGSHASSIYISLRNGSLYDRLFEAIKTLRSRTEDKGRQSCI